MVDTCDERLNEKLGEKYQALLEYLESLGSVAVAFSGGVDSTFLLHAAQDALGGNVVAVTFTSPLFPERELKEAAAFCKAAGIRQVMVGSRELEIEGFAQNPTNRCYLCKRELLGKIGQVAQAEGAAAVVEGSNLDDEADYRPGLQAVAELGIKSPLRAVGLTKAEIRGLSCRFGLPTWDKQSFACLATRFPYGDQISEAKLQMVDKAEQLLFDLGFRQARVRIHGNLARIEILPEEFSRFMEEDVRIRVDAAFREYGFAYVTLDVRGYRTGSMNEVI
ncbi:MAG: ATP-dependent sacrificial sulfur transferase LarE [Eggerthellales bacterium]|nr:ATP-dependent sacrificial sulfur transferase LarE [Eggerthellales bacterium]